MFRYDERLKTVMKAYALGADDVLRLYEIFVQLDYRKAGTITEPMLFKSLVSYPEHSKMPWVEQVSYLKHATLVRTKHPRFLGPGRCHPYT